MDRQFSLMDGQGWLTLREEGPRVCFRAELPDDGRGLYKAYLTGPGGGRVLLGTLIPEGGALRLTRTLSAGELARRGVWPPEGAQAELAFPAAPAGWTREERPARLMGERMLARCAEGLRGVLLRRRKGDFSLAVPWEAGREFPLTPLFCFARVERLAGKDYAVFRFSARGCPKMPHKTPPEGDAKGVLSTKE